MTTIDNQASRHVTMDEIVTTVIMARVTDFFGFFVYAIASAIVFPQLFFPNYDPVTGTILSFLLFSLAFIARPLAGLLGRRVQRQIGRQWKVVAALMILGTSTVAIGLLDTKSCLAIREPVTVTVSCRASSLSSCAAADMATSPNAAPANTDEASRRVLRLYPFTVWTSKWELLNRGS